MKREEWDVNALWVLVREAQQLQRDRPAATRRGRRKQAGVIQRLGVELEGIMFKER